MKEKKELKLEELDRVSGGAVGDIFEYEYGYEKKTVAAAYGIGIDISYLSPKKPGETELSYSERLAMYQEAIEKLMETGYTEEQALELVKSYMG